MTTLDHPTSHARTGQPGPDLGRVAFLAGVVGVGALVLALLVGLFTNFAGFFHAYLLAFLFWAGLSLGSIVLMMVYQVTGGRWGDILRPYFETAAKAVPLLALLFIPLLLGMGYNYRWMSEEVRATNEYAHYQYEKWLNPPFFILRAAIYFAIWFVMARILTKGGREKDLLEPAEGSRVGRSPRLAALGGPGIILYVVVLTAAVVDWAMSVEPGWFSTLYGLLLLVGQGLSTMAAMTVALVYLSRRMPGEAAQERESLREEAGKVPAASGAVAGNPDSLADREVHGPHAGGARDHSDPHPETHDDEDGPAHHAHPAMSPTDWGDLGNLMFLFTMFWGYLNLSQFLIVYSGNIPTETIFYHPRTMTSWKWVGLALVLFQFAVPFFCLITRDIKRNGCRLVIVALLILVMRNVDFYWQLQPSFAGGKDGITLYAANFLMPIALGGIWIAHFAWQFRGRRVLPQPMEGGHHG